MNEAEIRQVKRNAPKAGLKRYATEEERRAALLAQHKARYDRERAEIKAAEPKPKEQSDKKRRELNKRERIKREIAAIGGLR